MVTTMCDPKVMMREFKINSSDRDPLFGNISVNNTGTYTITVIFDQPNKYFPTTISKEFHVMEN